jgi:ABC-type multidrug transport system ATPase subunit
MRTILEADALEKSWSGRRIFSGISLSVERGLTAVSGENGSGKTTLLKILAFLLRPDSGAVRVRADGENAAGDRRRRAVGWAGPDLAFYEDLTGEENLLFFRRAGGMPVSREEIRARLAAVGLAAAADSLVGAFSTGMKQRLRLAFATLFDAPILLLDEPAAGLDLPGRETAFRLVEERRRTGAVVLASSDPRDFDRPDAVVELGGAGNGKGGGKRETGDGKRET